MKTRILTFAIAILVIFIGIANSHNTLTIEFDGEEYAQLSNLRPIERNRILSRLSKEKKARYLQIGLAGVVPDLSHTLGDLEFYNRDKGYINWGMRIALDDQPTIEHLNSGTGREGYYLPLDKFRDSQSPNAIVFYARWIYSDEPYKWEGSDALVLVPSFNAIDGMLSLLPNMTELPEAVRDWAKHFEETKTKFYAEQLPSSRGIPPEFVHKFVALQDREIQRFENGRRTTLQKWWKVNQKAFLEKRYPDVVPGEPQVVPPIAPDFASVKLPEKIAPVPVPFGEVAPPRPPLQEAPSFPIEFILSALFLLGGFGIYFKRRKGKT